MPFEAFTENAFRGKSLRVIEQANAILEEYKAQGFVLTLRQLYYQFVARDIIPNRQTEYKKLGAILSKARLAGLVDWDMMEDRTRNMQFITAWESPESIMSAVANQYREDLWEDQPRYVVVLEEKDALLGVIEPICRRLRVPFMSCRGHMSQSEMYTLGKRLESEIANGKEPLVIHLGDHDPSGVHMTDDIETRLTLFAGQDVEVNRIALNMDQIRRYNPPPNPAKESDARFDGYVSRFGTTKSWELDALSPTVIADLIRDAVAAVRDDDLWRASMRKEAANKKVLQGVESSFEAVGRYLKFRHTEIEIDGSAFYSADDILMDAENQDAGDEPDTEEGDED